MLDVRPVTPSIGAEVRGISLSDPLADDDRDRLERALVDRKTLFLRDQDITSAQHIAFGRRFGELEVHPFVGHKPGFPEVMVLTHDRDRRGTENAWHSDVTWRIEPSLGSVLRAVEVPDVGGDTLFADMEAAYEGLPDRVKEQLDGLTAIHDFTHVFGPTLSPERLEEMRDQYPPAEHPVVRTHPSSGRKSIYVNVAFTVRIVGLADDESARLLRELYRQSFRPEYQCRFRWAPGSIAFWDNRAAQHYAVSDYWPHRRVMERVTIVGTKPY